MCLPERVIDLAEEATRLQAENTRMAAECAQLSAEKTQLMEDHAWLQDQAIRITEEVKARNQEIMSKCHFPDHGFMTQYTSFGIRVNQNVVLQP
jgi:predicted nuclease with TOPRIM domain